MKDEEYPEYGASKEVLEQYVPRDLEKTIKKYIDRPEIIAITGPRQSGKTTLLTKIYGDLDNSHFISFEDREALELFEEDEMEFAKIHLEDYDYLLIDEFQYASKGGRKLKRLYDKYSDKKIIITGSSTAELTVKGLRKLTGRVFNFELHPFSFREYLKCHDEKLYEIHEDKSKEVRSWIEKNDSEKSKAREKPSIPETTLKKIEDLRKEYLTYGGYPKVALAESEEEKRTLLKNVINTYLLREIRGVLNIPEEHEIRKLMKLLSLQIGNLMNHSKLRDRAGLKQKELKEKLSILEHTFIIKRIKPFYTNKQKEIVKNPKIYFYDPGLRNALIKNFKKPENRSDRGELNENFFFSQSIDKDVELKYWRTKAKAEADFVLDQPENQAFEIKTTPRITRSLRSYINSYEPKCSYVMNEEELKNPEPGVYYVPLIFSGAILGEEPVEP